MTRIHCPHCDQDVCYAFLPVDEAETTCVEFKICGLHKGYQKIAVKKNNLTVNDFGHKRIGGND